MAHPLCCPFKASVSLPHHPDLWRCEATESGIPGRHGDGCQQPPVQWPATSEKTIEFHILCFVCDAPAKAFMKNVKLCTGYYGCDRCVQRGEWYQKVTYQDTEVVARSDDSFRQQTQGEHHHGSTPLLDLPINMISACPIDCTHQVCLGVMNWVLLISSDSLLRGRELYGNQFLVYTCTQCCTLWRMP